MRIIVIICIVSFLTSHSINIVAAEDWPCLAADAARSGQTNNTLNLPLHKVWTYTAAQKPQPAWSDSASGQTQRVDFDYGTRPVIAGGLSLFASSADDTLRALDLSRGSLQWSFTANGPLRFAPHIADGRVYQASDDGFLYCLNLKDGKEIWRFQAGLNNRVILGNGRTISRWPLRSGVLVDKGVAYLTAGVWPSEGVYIYALNAKSGEIIWCNDRCSTLLMPSKHIGAIEYTGICPQGYLSASSTRLIVTTGRGSPHQFDRTTGKLLTQKHPLMINPSTGKFYTNSTDYNNMPLSGGVWTSVIEEKGIYLGCGHVGNGFATYLLADSTLQNKDSMKKAPFPIDIRSGRRAIITKEKSYVTSGHANALTSKYYIFSYSNELHVKDRNSGEKTIVASFDNDSVRGIAIADGHLLVGTTNGHVYAYAATDIAVSTDALQFTARTQKSASADSKRIINLLNEKQIRKGYAYIINPPDAKIAEQLVQDTEMHCTIIMKDAQKVHSERQRLITDSSNYGSRISIILVEDFSSLPISSYCANLMVLAGSNPSLNGEEIYRGLRPCGGLMLFTNAAENDISKTNLTAHIAKNEISTWENKLLISRGKLPGAFDWDSSDEKSHLSDYIPWKKIKGAATKVDKRVSWPLEMVWFGGPGAEIMANRHWKPSTPLPANGRYFVVGGHHVLGVDAYNGTTLWEIAVRDAHTVSQAGKENITSAPSVVRSLNANDDTLYINLGSSIIQVDAQTGKQISVYSDAPAPKRFSLSQSH
ncbi:MAG: PQQ-like beta-propeller repeat protein, partial [Planctomycetes bacterium]|nr:PQQ-like beta-propeller repeat protein [Planctomycetota bacterium]